MKMKTMVAAMSVVVLAACGEKAAETEKEVTLDTVEKRLSYMVGNNMAQQFKRDEIDINITALTMGIEDAVKGADSRLTEEVIQETIATLQERAQQRQAEQQAALEQQRAEAAEKNKTEGEAYLAENKAKEGVEVTESGLQYRELVAGEGEVPSADDTVSVHYKGTLVDGTEFDSSYARGEPATFPVMGVIPGWVEALQMMNVGDKWELVIPSDLAYGPGGTGGPIGPNSTLIFEVELLEVIKPEPEVDVSK